MSLQNCGGQTLSHQPEICANLRFRVRQEWALDPTEHEHRLRVPSIASSSPGTCDPSSAAPSLHRILHAAFASRGSSGKSSDQISLNRDPPVPLPPYNDPACVAHGFQSETETRTDFLLFGGAVEEAPRGAWQSEPHALPSVSGKTPVLP